MTETSSTTARAAEAGIVAHALRALADHIERHHLPIPAEMQFDDDLTRLELHLSGCDAAAWWTPLQIAGCVDEVDVEAIPESIVEWVTLQARLPDTGVRVQLQWIRRRNAQSVAQVSA